LRAAEFKSAASTGSATSALPKGYARPDATSCDGRTDQDDCHTRIHETSFLAHSGAWTVELVPTPQRSIRKTSHRRSGAMKPDYHRGGGSGD
jgi:hypothetical protein